LKPEKGASLFTMKEREGFSVPIGFRNQHGSMRQSLLEANLSNDIETSKQDDSSKSHREKSRPLFFRNYPLRGNYCIEFY
jgi:hypothetical protein